MWKLGLSGHAARRDDSGLEPAHPVLTHLLLPPMSLRRGQWIQDRHSALLPRFGSLGWILLYSIFMLVQEESCT